MSILDPRDCYHTGIVSHDIDASTEQLTRVGGYTWTRSPLHDSAVHLADGTDTVLQIRRAYSMDAPYLEVVQSMEGTIWWPDPNSAIHHIGYFVDDVAAVSAELTAAGLPLAVAGRDGDLWPTRFAYHRSTEGIYIEIVERSRFPDFDAYLRSEAQ